MWPSAELLAISFMAAAVAFLYLAYRFWLMEGQLRRTGIENQKLRDALAESNRKTTLLQEALDQCMAGHQEG